MFTARDPPQAVVYLDCEQTDADIFSLKWCWPQTYGIHVTHSVLEVKDGGGVWQPLDGPFDGTSYIFQGKDYFVVLVVEPYPMNLILLVVHKIISA